MCKMVKQSWGQGLRLKETKAKPNYNPNKCKPHCTLTDIMLCQQPNLHMFCMGMESQPKAERSHWRSEGVNNAGHMESWEDGYMWWSSIGVLRRWL
jgi:hypothetical protein